MGMLLSLTPGLVNCAPEGGLSLCDVDLAQQEHPHISLKPYSKDTCTTPDGVSLATLKTAITDVIDTKFCSSLVLEFLGLTSSNFVSTHKFYLREERDRDLELELYLSRLADIIDKTSSSPSVGRPAETVRSVKSVVTLREQGCVELNSGETDYKGFWRVLPNSTAGSWGVYVYVDSTGWTFSLPFSTVFQPKACTSK